MKIACIMMQKNERELLDIWIQYHGSLFGYENLYIFDNGSDEDVKNVLKKYYFKGINLIFEHNKKSDFENKGGIFSEFIKNLDGQGKYDFYFPLDCDEFIGVFNHQGVVSCKKEDILFELEGHKNSNDALFIKYQLSNSATRRDFFRKDWTKKTFFIKNTIRTLDMGFHNGKTHNQCNHVTNIIYFHFHYKPFDLVKESAKNKLKDRVDVNNIEALRSYNGAGFHLKSYFFMTENEYIQGFGRTHQEMIPSFSNYLDSINIKYPFIDYINKLEIERGSVVGVIDSVEIDTDANVISIQGWCENNHDALYRLQVNDVLFEPYKVSKIRRDDVVKIHPNFDIFCGFVLQFKILDLTDISSIELMVLIKEQEFNLANARKLQKSIFEACYD